MFQAGIEKVMAAGTTTRQGANGDAQASGQLMNSGGENATMISPPPSIDELSTTAGIHWQQYFPFVTDETSPLIAALMAQGTPGTIMPEASWMFDVSGQLNQFLYGDDDVNLDFLTLMPV